jgi:MarR family transcriptional regulator, multiple antibiotic resistance protein MarR
MADIYDQNTYEPRKGIGHLLVRARATLLAAIDEEMAADAQLGPIGVTSAQFVLLATVSMGDARSASDACRAMSYDGGAMTRLINRLEQKGLLRRTRPPNDRRIINLELTVKGAAALPVMRLAVIRVLNRFLRGFSLSEARQMEALLSRMLGNAARLG